MNIRLHLQFCLPALAILILPSGCLGQHTKTAVITTDFRMSELNMLIGRVARSLGEKSEIKAAMPRLLHWWQERGALGAANTDLSNALLFTMEENPTAFFAWMSDHPNEFQEWLKALPDDSFVWEAEPPCPLDAKREELISLLKMTHLEDPKLSQLKEQTLLTLSAIRCQQVQ